MVRVEPEPKVSDGAPPEEPRGRWTPRGIGWMDDIGALVRKESLGGTMCQKIEQSTDAKSNKKKTHTRLLIDVQMSLMSDRDG